MENKNWWEATVRRDVMQKNGTNKLVSEHYLISSPSCTDAEKRIIDEMAPYCTVGIKVTDIKTRKFREVIFSEEDSDEKWYKVKAYFLILNENTGEEKKKAVLFLVQAYNLRKAIYNFEKSMAGSLIDFELDEVKLSPILDVFSSCAEDVSKS